MGIRIHKAMGWGLTNVKTKKHKIVDERFGESILTDPEADHLSVEEFLKWLKNNPQQSGFQWKSDIYQIESHLKNGTIKSSDLTSCFIHGTEYLNSKIFCCVPITYPDWTRYDDPIDYNSSKDGLNHVKVLKFSIFPYARYWDIRDGRFLSSGSEMLLNSKINLDTFAKSNGFINHAEATEYVRPAVPEIIQAQLIFARIFRDPDTIRQLQPMIYTYWC